MFIFRDLGSTPTKFKFLLLLLNNVLQGITSLQYASLVFFSFL